MNDNELKEVLAVVHGLLPDEKNTTPQVVDFTAECIDMIKLYTKKNHDYGDSFNQGMKDIGLAYGVGRLYDKMNRILTLMKVKAEVNDESIQDTVQDLACYGVMLSVYLKKYSNTQSNN